MKSGLMLSIFAVATFIAAIPCQAGDKATTKTPEYIFNAMNDEMSRSMSGLIMDDLQMPYFMAYTVSDREESYFAATFGALTAASENSKDRLVKAEVRIGTSSFDSTLFVGNPYGDYEPTYAYSPFVGNYGTLRHTLWRATDAAYKEALDTFSKKIAFVQSKNIEELYDDHSPAPVLEYDETFTPAPFDSDKARSLVKEISAIFKEYPEIDSSAASIYRRHTNDYFINSEGSRYAKSSCLGSVEMSASAMVGDGYSISEYKKFEFCDPKDIPSKKQLEDTAREMASQLTKDVRSETLQAYIGPVLFEGYAAGSFFEGLFVNNVANPREVWRTESQWSRGYIYSRAGELDERLGMRVLPPFLNAYDDPFAEKYNGTFLAGNYKVDDEGTAAQKIDLVSRGRLTDYYRFRAATRDFPGSNGHGRGEAHENITGGPGNIFIQPDETSQFTVPAKELKQKLIDLCREQELEYGLVIRYMGGLSSVFHAYKVYPDGHEEPVHALVFSGLGLRSLRDIAYASRELSVNSLSWSPPASLICPDILVREMEVRRTSGKPPKKPYLPHPYFNKN